MTVKVASIAQGSCTKRLKTSDAYGTIKRGIKVKKYLIEEFNSMPILKKQQFLELPQKVGFLQDEKTQESSKKCGQSSHTYCKVRQQEKKKSNNESLFLDKKS